MMGRHRKPSLAAVTRISGVAAVAFQLAGLVLVIIGGWGAAEGSITNLGIFCMTLAAFATVAHVIYRRTPALLAKRQHERDLVARVEPAYIHEQPTVPGLTIARDPNVTTIKVPPRPRKTPHKRVESKK